MTETETPEKTQVDEALNLMFFMSKCYVKDLLHLCRKYDSLKDGQRKGLLANKIILTAVKGVYCKWGKPRYSSRADLVLNDLLRNMKLWSHDILNSFMIAKLLPSVIVHGENYTDVVLTLKSAFYTFRQNAALFRLRLIKELKKDLQLGDKEIELVNVNNLNFSLYINFTVRFFNVKEDLLKEKLSFVIEKNKRKETIKEKEHLFKKQKYFFVISVISVRNKVIVKSKTTISDIDENFAREYLEPVVKDKTIDVLADPTGSKFREICIECDDENEANDVKKNILEMDQILGHLKNYKDISIKKNYSKLIYDALKRSKEKNLSTEQFMDWIKTIRKYLNENKFNGKDKFLEKILKKTSKNGDFVKEKVNEIDMKGIEYEDDKQGYESQEETKNEDEQEKLKHDEILVEKPFEHFTEETENKSDQEGKKKKKFLSKLFGNKEKKTKEEKQAKKEKKKEEKQEKKRLKEEETKKAGKKQTEIKSQTNEQGIEKNETEKQLKKEEERIIKEQKKKEKEEEKIKKEQKKKEKEEEKKRKDQKKKENEEEERAKKEKERAKKLFEFSIDFFKNESHKKEDSSKKFLNDKDEKNLFVTLQRIIGENIESEEDKKRLYYRLEFNKMHLRKNYEESILKERLIEELGGIKELRVEKVKKIIKVLKMSKSVIVDISVPSTSADLESTFAMFKRKKLKHATGFYIKEKKELHIKMKIKKLKRPVGPIEKMKIDSKWGKKNKKTIYLWERVQFSEMRKFSEFKNVRDGEMIDNINKEAEMILTEHTDTEVLKAFTKLEYRPGLNESLQVLLSFSLIENIRRNRIAQNIPFVSTFLRAPDLILDKQKNSEEEIEENKITLSSIKKQVKVQKRDDSKEGEKHIKYNSLYYNSIRFFLVWLPLLVLPLVFILAGILFKIPSLDIIGFLLISVMFFCDFLVVTLREKNKAHLDAGPYLEKKILKKLKRDTWNRFFARILLNLAVAFSLPLLAIFLDKFGLLSTILKPLDDIVKNIL